MREVLLIFTLVHFPTEDHVGHMPFRFPGVVTLRECMAMLEAEPTFDTTIPENIDMPIQDPRMVVHSLRDAEREIEEESAKSGRPVDAIFSCEEWDVPEPWGRIVDF